MECLLTVSSWSRYIASLGAVLTLAASGQARLLHDGQQLTLQGTLTVEPAGRLHIVLIKTASTFVPMLMGAHHSEHPASTVSSIGLSGYHRYDLLYAHRGQVVTVAGKVMTDDASPYYTNNILLNARSIRLANGTELIGSPRASTPLAVDVGEYRASVVLPADLARPWEYTAQGNPDADGRFLSCGSNGGGDVVNCSCAGGFRVIHAESSTKGVTARVFADSHTAQFDVGDDARRVNLSVTCSR